MWFFIYFVDGRYVLGFINVGWGFMIEGFFYDVFGIYSNIYVFNVKKNLNC